MHECWFSDDEIAVRFHHRLVQIHVFVNGNGRHARLMADLLLKKLGAAKFTWGSQLTESLLEAEGKTRSAYLSALKNADKDNFVDLIRFARS